MTKDYIKITKENYDTYSNDYCINHNCPCLLDIKDKGKCFPKNAKQEQFSIVEEWINKNTTKE